MELIFVFASYLTMGRCKSIIIDIYKRMADGMIDFTKKNTERGSVYFEEIAEYDLYAY